MSHEHMRRNSYITGLVDRMLTKIDLSETADDVILTAMRKRLGETLTCLNMAMTVDMKSAAREQLCAQWSAIVLSIGFDMEYYRRIKHASTDAEPLDGRIVKLKMCYLG